MTETKQDEKQDPIDYAKLLTEARELTAKQVAEYRDTAQAAIREARKRVDEAEDELLSCDNAHGAAKLAAVLAARSSELSALMVTVAIRVAAFEISASRSAGPLGMFGL